MAETARLPRSSTAAQRPLLVAASISVLLAILKFAAFIMTGSAIILGSLLDSISDSVVSLVNYRVTKLARAAPDREHPFGHGGIEVASSLLQGIVLALFGIYLASQSIERWRNPIHLLDNQREFLIAFAIMLFAAVCGFLIQLMLNRMQKKLLAMRERSLSITADAGHYQGDFWYNLLNAIGLASIWFSGVLWLDGAFGLVGALMFLRSSVPILKHGMSDLLQTEVSAQEQKQLVTLILETDAEIQGVHRLRTRRAGPTLFLDFHMKLPAMMPLENAHLIGEKVSANIRRAHPRADVVIHLDPDSEPDDDYWRPTYKR